MMQIDALANELKKAGIKAKVWLGYRIYLNNLGRDIKAYIELDYPGEAPGDNLFHGCSLKVYSVCDMPKVWRINRAKQVKHSLMLQLAECGIVKHDVCSDWREVIL